MAWVVHRCAFIGYRRSSAIAVHRLSPFIGYRRSSLRVHRLGPFIAARSSAAPFICLRGHQLERASV
jgi:hypothetical protein